MPNDRGPIYLEKTVKQFKPLGSLLFVALQILTEFQRLTNSVLPGVRVQLGPSRRVALLLFQDGTPWRQQCE